MTTEPATILKTLTTFTEKKNGSYIVLLHGHIDKSNHFSQLHERLKEGESVTYDNWDSNFVHGYAIQLNTDSDAATLNYLLAHPDVRQLCDASTVFSDIKSSIIRLLVYRKTRLSKLALNRHVATQHDCVLLLMTYSVFIQTNAPWGLERISQRGKLDSQDAAGLNFTYYYEDGGSGKQCDVYVVGRHIP
jgi:hypothetical protein